MVRSSRERREQFKRLARLTEAQAALGWAIILILATLLGTIYLLQTSRIATTGRQIQLSQEELDNMRRENSDLEKRIAEAQSLDRLQSEARRLGFVPARADDIEYLVVPDFPATAVIPEPIVEPTPEIELPATMQEAILQTVQTRLNDLARGEAGE